MNYPVKCKECGTVVTWEYDKDGEIVCTKCYKPLPDNSGDEKKVQTTTVITNKGGKRIMRS